MNPGLALSAAAALGGFVLKTALAFAVCLGVSRLAGSPGRRFAVWAAYLFGATALWLRMLAGLLPGLPAAIPAPASAPAVSTAGISSHPPSHAHRSAILPPHLSSVFSSTGQSGPVPGLGFPSGTERRPASLRVPAHYALPLRIFLSGAGAAYACALVYILFEYIKRKRKLKWILGFAWPPPAHAEAMFRQLTARVGAPRAELLVLAGADSPATFGWIKPVVVAPEECLREGFEGLESILVHELHHVRRRDYAWNQLALMCRALLVFHPAAWFAASRMQMERELACDLAVVADSPADKAEYAECLLRFARLQSAQQPQPWGIDFAGPAGRLKSRIELILEEPKRKSLGIRVLRFGVTAMLLAAFLYAAPSLQILLRYGPRPASPQIGLAPQGETTPPASAGNVHAAKRAPWAWGYSGRFGRSWPAEGNRVERDGTAPRNLATATAPPLPLTARGLAASTPGPHLLRRSLGPGNTIKPGGAARRESIVLVDSDSSAEAKTEQAKTRKQGLKQAAVALLAIGKVVSDVDHR